MQRRAFLAVTAATLAAPAVHAQPAKVIKFAPQADLALLDPHFAPALVTRNHAYLVYDTLYGVDDAAQPRPQMAAGHVVEDNGLTWKITLRDGLRFHDNTPVLARDVVASLKRWATRDVYASSVWGQVEEVSAPSDKVVQFRLKKPFRLLADMLGKQNPFAPVIMPERLASTPPAQQVTEIVGSGPFRYLANERVAGSRNVYEKWPGYVPRQEPAIGSTGGKVVHVDRVEWHTIPDPATAAAALQSGEIDWWEQPTADLLPTLRRRQGVTVDIIDTLGYNAVMRFNHLHPPFNNLALRRAIALGLPQEDYMRAVTANDESLFTTCKALFPCGTRYGQEIGKAVIQGDLAAARAAVKNSGYNGEKIVLLNPADVPSIAPFGHVTYDYFRKLGLNVELADTDWGSLVQRRNSKEPVEKGGWSVFHTWWFGTSLAHPAISNIIRGLGARGWAGWYENAKVESLTAEWLAAAAEADRDRLAAAIHQETMETLPSLPLGRFFINTAYRKDLKGMLEGTSPVPWNLEWA